MRVSQSVPWNPLKHTQRFPSSNPFTHARFMRVSHSVPSKPGLQTQRVPSKNPLAQLSWLPRDAHSDPTKPSLQTQTPEEVSKNPLTQESCLVWHCSPKNPCSRHTNDLRTFGSLTPRLFSGNLTLVSPFGCGVTAKRSPCRVILAQYHTQPSPDESAAAQPITWHDKKCVGCMIS